MKANELRIGNIIGWLEPDRENDDTLFPVDVVGVDSEHISVSIDGIGYKYNQLYQSFKPIPITDGWLLKLGFLKDGAFWHHETYTNFTLEEFRLDANKVEGYVFMYGGSVMNRVIKEVHVLQNAFWLTGSELTISEK